jgi:hypothetical protein
MGKYIILMAISLVALFLPVNAMADTKINNVVFKDLPVEMRIYIGSTFGEKSYMQMWQYGEVFYFAYAAKEQSPIYLKRKWMIGEDETMLEVKVALFLEAMKQAYGFEITPEMMQTFSGKNHYNLIPESIMGEFKELLFNNGALCHYAFAVRDGVAYLMFSHSDGLAWMNTDIPEGEDINKIKAILWLQAVEKAYSGYKVFPDR